MILLREIMSADVASMLHGSTRNMLLLLTTVLLAVAATSAPGTATAHAAFLTSQYPRVQQQRSRRPSPSLLSMSTLSAPPSTSRGGGPSSDTSSSDDDASTLPSPPTTTTTTSTRGGISMGINELAQLLGGVGRAQLAWDCYRVGVDPANLFGSVIRLGYDDFETIYDLLPSCRRTQSMGAEALARLAATYTNSQTTTASGGGRVEGGVASLSYISQSGDDTTKLLLKLEDGLEVETVIIPWQRNGRSTLCISCQVGCKQGCTFCATGKMGFVRSLTSDEILSQFFYAKKICRLYDLPDVTNVVFMGMGEASDCAAEVKNAVDVLTTRELFQLSATKVTVSTVAPTPDAFKQFADSSCVIAWSVHAVNDVLRKRLVPSTKYKMTELRQGLIETLLQRPKPLRTTMLEVALMAGVNDSEKEADELAEFAHVIMESVPDSKLIVNLIPFNDIGNSSYERPTTEAVTAFQQRLKEKGIFTHVRSTRGGEKEAACGQLSTKRQQQQQQQKKSQVPDELKGKMP